MTTSLNTLSLQTRSASIALALAMAAGTCLAQDGAAASFERMLAHQPATHQPATAAMVLDRAVRPRRWARGVERDVVELRTCG